MVYSHPSLSSFISPLCCERSNLGGKLCGFHFKTLVGFGDFGDCSEKWRKKKSFLCLSLDYEMYRGYFLGKRTRSWINNYLIYLIPPYLRSCYIHMYEPVTYYIVLERMRNNSWTVISPHLWIFPPREGTKKKRERWDVGR